MGLILFAYLFFKKIFFLKKPRFSTGHVQQHQSLLDFPVLTWGSWKLDQFIYTHNLRPSQTVYLCKHVNKLY